MGATCRSRRWIRQSDAEPRASDWVDTNVIVRYIVQDDAEQTEAAAAILERVIDHDSLFLTQIVLCELVWVLSYAYRFSRAEIVEVLNGLRRTAGLRIEGADEVKHAIEAYAGQHGDFAGYLIAERSIANGCSSVVTFDRALRADRRFTSPSAPRSPARPTRSS